MKAAPAKRSSVPRMIAVQPSLTAAQIRIILAVGLAFGIGVLYQFEPLNGLYDFTRWEWPWQDLDPFAVGVVLLLPFALISGVLWLVEKRISITPWLVLGILTVSNFLLQLFGTLADPRGIQRIAMIVASPDATAYFNDALRIQASTGGLIGWLSNFHTAVLLPHSSEHPPGPIVFYYLFLKLFGPETGALVGGCVVGLAGSAGVLVMYKFSSLWNQETKTRLTACALYALIPGLIVFLPEFDQAYPIISMFLILLWVRSLDGSKTAPFFMGAVLFVSTLFAYNLLIVGAFLVYYSAYWIWQEGNARGSIFKLLRAAAPALLVFAALHTILWLTTGYRAWASFHHALANQSELLKQIYRPYVPYVLTDPYDFALGAGILAAPMALIHVFKSIKKLKQREAALTVIGMATILTVDLSGLLPGETARVWLFLQPLLIVPAAIELATVSWPWRFSIFTVQWWIVVCLKAKMAFVEP
jgi:hypothetical protein